MIKAFRFLFLLNFALAVYAVSRLDHFARLMENFLFISSFYYFFNTWFLWKPTVGLLYSPLLLPAAVAVAWWIPHPRSYLFLLAVFRLEVLRYSALIGMLFLFLMLGGHASPKYLPRIYLLVAALTFVVAWLQPQLYKAKNYSYFGVSVGQFSKSTVNSLCAILLFAIIVIPCLETILRQQAMSVGINIATPGSAKHIKTFPKDRQMNDVAYSPDGKVFATYSSGISTSRVVSQEIRSAESNKFQSGIPLNKTADHLSFSPDGKYLLVGLKLPRAEAQQSGFEVWDWKTSTRLDRFHLPDQFRRKLPDKTNFPSFSLGLSDNGKYLLVGSGADMELWNFESGEYIRSAGSGHYGTSCIWLDSERYVLIDGNEVKIIDARTNQIVSRKNIIRNRKVRKMFVQEKKILFAFTRDSQPYSLEAFELWDIEAEQLTLSFFPPSNAVVRAYTYSPTRSILAVERFNNHQSPNTIELWDIERKTLIHSITPPFWGVERLVFDQSGQKLLALGRENLVVYDIDTL